MKEAAKKEAVNLKVGDRVTLVSYLNGYVERTYSIYIGKRRSKKRDVLVTNSSLFLALNKLNIFELSEDVAGFRYRVIEIDRKPSLLKSLYNLLTFKK